MATMTLSQTSTNIPHPEPGEEQKFIGMKAAVRVRPYVRHTIHPNHDVE